MFPRAAEHRPGDRLIGDNRSAAVLDMICHGIGPPLEPGHAAQDRRPLTLADRALQCAQAGDDPLTTADAQRAVATVLRRTGRRAKAHDLLLTAATAIEPGKGTTPESSQVFGMLLEVAAYTAAVDGNRGTAQHLIGEAKCRRSCNSPPVRV